MKLLIFLLTNLISITSFAATSASSLKLKIYQVSISTSTDCTNPLTVFISVPGTETDFMTGPVLGSGSIPDGSYPCIMITMDDVIKYTPATNEGACSATTEYTADLCRDLTSSGGAGNERWSFTDLLEGTTFTDNVECEGTNQSVLSGGVANKVTLYLRTTATPLGDADEEYVASWKRGMTEALSVDSGAGPSIDRDNGIKLENPFVVAGESVGIFYADSTGMVSNYDMETPGDASDDICEMNGVLFGFR